MTTIRLVGVSFGYSDAVDILTDVDLHLGTGWTGIVGANGAGKSTLLGLLGGTLRPSRGVRVLDPPDTHIAGCVQEPSATPQAWRSADRRAVARLRGLWNLDPAELGRWPTLSPGQRQRWCLFDAIVTEPEVLLLDEPTNHLDADAHGALVAALRGFRGVGVIVSHDRALLDAITSTTLRVREGAVDVMPGPHGAACHQWALAAAHARAARAEATTRRDHERRKLALARNDRAGAERERSSARRMRGPRDHDARSMGRKFAVDRAEARAARRVHVAHGALAAAERALDEHAVEIERGGALFVDWRPPARARLASIVIDRLTAADRVLAEDVRLTLEVGDRIGVHGGNGVGKTTLLHAVLHQVRVPPERVLLLPQQLPTDAAATLTRALALADPEVRARTWRIVAALGVDPGRMQASAAWSPGELRKLWLARGLAQQVWLVVLDEPTNHLDLPSIERLEAALAAYPVVHPLVRDLALLQ